MYSNYTAITHFNYITEVAGLPINREREKDLPIISQQSFPMMSPLMGSWRRDFRLATELRCPLGALVVRPNCALPPEGRSGGGKSWERGLDIARYFKTLGLGSLLNHKSSTLKQDNKYRPSDRWELFLDETPQLTIDDKRTGEGLHLKPASK